MSKSKGRKLSEWLRGLDANSKASSDSIKAGSITTAKLEDGAVTTSKLNDLGVTFGKLHTALVVTESGGIGNNDNDSTVATSAAIIDYVSTNTGITLTDLSVGTPNSASGSGAISYSNSTGVFKYTPPDLSSYLTSVPAQTFASLTGKPTTISGYGITDAFDGAYSSLSGKPTTISGYGITDAFDGAYSSLTGTPTIYTDSSVDSHLNQSNPTSGYVLSWNGSDYAWVAQSGNVTDITGHAAHLIRTDNRAISPSEYTAGDMNFGFTSWNNNNTSPYADFIHLRSYTDSSGGSDNLLMFKKSGVGMRLWQQTYGSSTAYSSPVNVLLYTSDSTIPQGVTASSVTTRTDLNMKNYRYNYSGGTPTRGEYGYHVYQQWTNNLALTLTDSSWQRGDIVEIQCVRADRTVSVTATRIYAANNTYDTEVTFNNKAGIIKLVKYSDTQGYWMAVV